MKREWEPGDVAMIEVGCHANRFIGLFTHRGWRYGIDKWVADDPAIVTARPLVRIDPESREQVERLAQLAADVAGRADHLSLWWTDLQAALREFANPTPTPPKPEEPQGLGAVVETQDGRFVRSDVETCNPWRGPNGVPFEWADIDGPVRVLSEGVAS